MTDRALDGVNYLRGRAEIDSARIGIVGQSAGGFVAAKAAARSKEMAFLVTLATPMGSIDATFDEVLDRLLRSGGASEQKRTRIRKMMQDTFAAAAKGADAATLRPAVEEFLRAEYAYLPQQQRRMAGKDADDFAQRFVENHVRDLTTPMYRTMIGYDIGQTVSNINCPMLILFAEKDIKVEPNRGSQIATALLQKSGRTNGTVKIITEATHFFERSEQEAESESSVPERRFAPMFLELMRNWLLKNTALRAESI